VLTGRKLSGVAAVPANCGGAVYIYIYKYVYICVYRYICIYM